MYKIYKLINAFQEDISKPPSNTHILIFDSYLITVSLNT